MSVLYERWEVTISHAWEKQFGDADKGATYTFATLRGCQDYITEQIERGNENPENRVLWYSIEGTEAIPCDENKPWGQLYHGMIYHKFVDLEREGR